MLGNLITSATSSGEVLDFYDKYTNQQLTSAEVIAELVELAREVAAEKPARDSGAAAP